MVSSRDQAEGRIVHRLIDQLHHRLRRAKVKDEPQMWLNPAMLSSRLKSSAPTPGPRSGVDPGWGCHPHPWGLLAADARTRNCGTVNPYFMHYDFGRVHHSRIIDPHGAGCSGGVGCVEVHCRTTSQSRQGGTRGTKPLNSGLLSPRKHWAGEVE